MNPLVFKHQMARILYTEAKDPSCYTHAGSNRAEKAEVLQEIFASLVERA